MNATRTIAATLLGAAALAVMILPRERGATEPVLNPLRQDLAHAASTLRIREAVAMRLLARAHARTTVAADDRIITVRIAPGMSEATRAFYDSTANAFIASLDAPVDPSMRLVVTVARDTAVSTALSKFDNWRDVGPQVFLPGTIRPNECHVFVGETFDGQHPERVTFSSLSWRIEACRPYLLYGMPGRGTTEWLRSLHYGPLFAFQPLEDIDASDVSGWQVFNRSSEGRRVRSCRSGRAESCDALMLTRPVGDSDFLMRDRRANAITGEIANPLVYGWGTTQIVLSRLQGQLGRDGIRALWRSDTSVALTIAALTGQPLSETVRVSLDDAFDRAPVSVRRFRPLGPLPRPGSLVLSALLVVLLITAAGVAVRRTGFTS